MSRWQSTSHKALLAATNWGSTLGLVIETADCADMDFSQLRWFLPPSKRAMVFVDGENLVCRFQEMVSGGAKPHPDTQHTPDVFVWQRGFTHLVAVSYDVLRTYYYTSAIGDDTCLAGIHDELAGIEFSRHHASNVLGYLLPRVFKRTKGTVRSKGVDIALAVELLSNVTRGNVDAVLLLSGDGDFVPLVEEVMRHGVTFHLAAFTSGLNRDLRRTVDSFAPLDDMAFIKD